MSEDPQQTPDKFKDEQPYGGEESESDTRPDAPEDSDTEADETG